MAVNYHHEWMINMIRSTLREIEVATGCHRASHSAEDHMRYEQSVFFAITVLGTNGGNQVKDRKKNRQLGEQKAERKPTGWEYH